MHHGKDWKWSEWLNQPSNRFEPCPAEAPRWSLLFQSRVNLRAGNRSKKTRKNHVRLRSTLVTCEKPLAAFYGQFGMSACIPCIFTYFDDLGIIILLFAFALRFFELQTAPWKPQGNQRVIESSSWVSWVLGKWNLVSSARHAKWMSFSRFWTKFTLGSHPHLFWMAETLQNCTERLNGVALHTYRRTKPPRWEKKCPNSLGVNLWHSTISARKWMQVWKPCRTLASN